MGKSIIPFCALKVCIFFFFFLFKSIPGNFGSRFLFSQRDAESNFWQVKRLFSRKWGRTQLEVVWSPEYCYSTVGSVLTLWYVYPKLVILLFLHHLFAKKKKVMQQMNVKTTAKDSIKRNFCWFLASLSW